MLEEQWDGDHKTLEYHFDDGKNHYFEAIETNLERIDGKLQIADGESQRLTFQPQNHRFLRRSPTGSLREVTPHARHWTKRISHASMHSLVL